MSKNELSINDFDIRANSNTVQSLNDFDVCVHSKLCTLSNDFNVQKQNKSDDDDPFWEVNQANEYFNSQMNIQLAKTKNKENIIYEAQPQIKEQLMEKNLGQDVLMMNMIDSITNKISDIDLSEGNITQKLFSIAQNVAHEISGCSENNPENNQHIYEAIRRIIHQEMAI